MPSTDQRFAPKSDALTTDALPPEIQPPLDQEKKRLDFSEYLFHFLADTIMNFSADAVERRRRTSSITNYVDDLTVRVYVLDFPAASAEDNSLPWGERPFNWKRSQYVSLGDQTELFSCIKCAVEIKLIDKLFAEYSRQEGTTVILCD